MSMVANVAVDWEKMAGTTDDVRKLNALLTAAFIGVHDMPADECLNVAVEVLKLSVAEKDDDTPDVWKTRGAKHVHTMFATGTNRKGEVHVFHQEAAIVPDVVDRIERVLNGGPWPDRPILV